MDLTEAQWEVVRGHIPQKEFKNKKRGRPWRDPRDVLNGVLWVLKTGAQWQELPKKYPPYQTCHRRFQEWATKGVFRKILMGLAEDLRVRGKLDLSEGFLDGSFASAKKGALELVLQSAAKGPRSWLSQTAMVYLSDSTLQVLHPTKQNLSKQL